MNFVEPIEKTLELNTRLIEALKTKTIKLSRVQLSSVIDFEWHLLLVLVGN